MEIKKHTNELYGMREGADEFPLMVVLSFVYVCNARCPNCPYNNSDIREDYKDALFMPSTLFRKIADECGPYGSYLRLSGGGEPMLHPEAVELMLYAKNKKAKIGLITNGSRFNEANLRTLLQAGVDVMEFSVDAGNAEEYAVVRPGVEWQTLIRNVKLAAELRKELNAPTKFIASIINQQGVDVKAAETFWSKLVDKVQIRKFLTWGYNKDNSADDTPYLPPEERVPCPWLFERLNIDSKGNVTLCGEDIAFKEKFDNITNKTIKEIWQGAKFEYFRGRHLARKGNEIDICSKCPDWQYRSWNYNYWKILKDADDARKGTG